MRNDSEKKRVRCCKCAVDMTPMKTKFSYLGREFSENMHRCPVCGQVFVPADIARGRMAQVEQTLEGK